MTNRIHITSSGPRTGTTLLTEVFKSCFEIDCACDHEASLSRSNSSFGNCNTVLTKLPSGTHGLQTILNNVENLFVVCIIRDPRDMVVSFHGRIPNQYYCGLNFWNIFLRDYRKVKKHPRFILIKYEDFTREPDIIQNYIEEKIPFLKRKYKFSEYHLHANPDDDTLKALRKLRPIESKGIGNWEKHLPRVKQQLNKYGNITDSLKQFEYETNEQWEKKLEDVSIKKFQSYKNENSLKYRSNKAIFITLFNFSCEKININPDIILRPFRYITRQIHRQKIEKHK